MENGVTVHIPFSPARQGRRKLCERTSELETAGISKFEKLWIAGVKLLITNTQTTTISVAVLGLADSTSGLLE